MTIEDAPQTPPSPVEIKVPPGKWGVLVQTGDGDPVEIHVEGPVVIHVSLWELVT